jgi:Tol biopolymer transport system component
LTKITENVVSYTWNPQGKQIAFTKGYGTLPEEFTFFMPINIVNVDSAEVEKTIPTCEQKGGNTAIRLAWSPDGKTILVSCLGGRAVRRDAIDLASGISSTLLTEELSGETAFAEFLTWSPDGKKILVADGAVDGAGSSMRVLDLKQGNSYLVSNDPTLFLYAGYAPWSPDSKRLLSLCFIRDSQTHSASMCVMDQNGDNFKNLTNIILDDVDWTNKSAQDKSQVMGELIDSFEDYNLENITRLHSNSVAGFNFIMPNLWSPDGNSILLILPNSIFDVNSGDEQGIYIVPINGGKLVKVADGWFAIWSR